MTTKWTHRGWEWWKEPAMWLEGWGCDPGDTALISREGRGAWDWVQSGNQWFSQSCLNNETPAKILDTQSSGELPGCERSNVVRGWHLLNPHWEGTRLYVWDPGPVCLCICLALIYNLCNKTVITRTVLSWVLWVLPANYEGVLGTPKFVTGWSEVTVAKDLPQHNWCLKPKWEQFCWGLFPVPVESAVAQNCTAVLHTKTARLVEEIWHRC